MVIRVHVLGPLRAWNAERPLDLGSPQQRAVFALLAVAGGRQVYANGIVDALWPAEPPPSAINTVQTYVKRLRGLLEPDRQPRQPGVLLRTSAGYALSVEDLELDLTSFRELVSAGREAERAGDSARAFGELRRALRLCRGPPLADLPLSGPESPVHRLERECCGAIALFAEVALAADRAGEALPVIEESAGDYVLDEQVQTRFMQLLAAVGRRSDAFAVYHRTRRRLAEDWGVDPGDDLQRAYVALLDDPTPIPLVSRPTLPVPAQLPLAVGDFTGRADEAARLADLLSPGPEARRNVPVVAVTGMGGIGKSTLAVYVAHRVAGEYPDGQLYVDLGGGRTEAAAVGSVLTRFLLSFVIEGSAIPEDLGARAALFRSLLANRRVLVVLDNAMDEAQVKFLLPGTPTCAAIITGRSHFTRLCGSAVVELDVLPADAALGLLSRVIGRDRLEAEKSAAVELVQLCDRIPLAVRLASAKLAARTDMSLARFGAAVADERRRLDQLDTRHDGIRATFAISYEALPANARTVFRHLGMLPVTDFACWVVAALMDCSLADAEDVLRVIVDARLVSISSPDAFGEVRYRMHDLVRLYGAERADAEESDDDKHAVASRTVGAWLSLAEHADAQLLRMPGAIRRETQGVLPTALGSTLRMLGRAEGESGDPTAARAALEQARDLYTGLGNEQLAEQVTKELLALED